MKVDDFKVGDRVHHIMIGDGKVIEADAQHVRVRFEHIRHRVHVEGVYDRQWFALNPEGYLFHRSDKRGELASSGGKPK